jgi:hypothetical protein
MSKKEYEYFRLRRITLSKEIDIETWPDELKPIVHAFHIRREAAKQMISMADHGYGLSMKYLDDVMKKCDEMICEFFDIKQS